MVKKKLTLILLICVTVFSGCQSKKDNQFIINAGSGNISAESKNSTIGHNETTSSAIQPGDNKSINSDAESSTSTSNTADTSNGEKSSAFSNDTADSNNEADPSVTSDNSPLDKKFLTTKIAQATTQGISTDEAINLCAKKLGDKDEETGNSLVYSYECTVSFQGKEYYVIYRSWIVDEGTDAAHPSFIGYAIVVVDGSEIYDGLDDQVGNYYVGDKLWGK